MMTVRQLFENLFGVQQVRIPSWVDGDALIVPPGELSGAAFTPEEGDYPAEELTVPDFTTDDRPAVQAIMPPVATVERACSAFVSTRFLVTTATPIQLAAANRFRRGVLIKTTATDGTTRSIAVGPTNSVTARSAADGFSNAILGSNYEPGNLWLPVTCEVWAIALGGDMQINVFEFLDQGGLG